MSKRILAMLLAVLMLTPALASCGEKDTSETTADASSAAEETETVDTSDLTDYEKRQLISDDLPEYDFGGQAFRVLMSEPNTATYDAVTYEIKADELTGDACNDAVYNRNIDIGERFNTVIELKEEKETWKTVINAVTAGTDDFDLSGGYNYTTYYYVAAETFLNWLDIPNVNLEKPWHNSLSNDGATINGILYAICSDLAITSMTYTYAIFFNVPQMENHGYPADDLYEMVRDGKWTIDKMAEMAASMYVDNNGDGKKDADDNYGFGYYIMNPADVWTVAFDQPITRINDQGYIEPALMCDKTISIVEKLYDFHYNNTGVYLNATQYDEETFFLNGKYVMAPLRFHVAYTDLRDMEDAYAMLPYPKWDEAQTEYYTNADDKYTAFGVPKTAYANREFIGTIFEALCAESYKKVYPAYYDIALKGKYSSDAGTAEMVDLIMAGRKFDFSFQFGESVFQYLPYLVRNAMIEKTVNIVSKYDSIEKKMLTAIESELLPLYGVE